LPKVLNERGGKSSFNFFLFSKGSVGEIRAQLMYAVDEGYLEEAQQVEADHIGREATRLIGGLMKHLNTCEIAGRKYLTPDRSGHTNRTTNRAAPDAKLKTQNAKPKT